MTVPPARGIRAAQHTFAVQSADFDGMGRLRLRSRLVQDSSTTGMTLRTLALCIGIAAPLTSYATDAVLPPGSSIAGRSPSQLAAQWWQWAMSAPDDENPVNDSTGAHCAVGQRGPVWFLAGGFGSSKVHRVCTIPPGRALFFPVINMVYLPRQGDPTFNCERAKAAAAINNETTLDLFAELDGVPIEQVKRHRVSSEKCFNVFARVPSAKRPYKAYPSATDGYWLLIKPLDKGRHVLKFGGRYNHSSSAFGRMVQDIEYELIVQ